MPDSMSIERRKVLKALGAEVVADAGRRRAWPGPSRRPRRLAAAVPNVFVPQQFENPANPEIHRRTTAEEIWTDTDGKVDILVSGVGTGRHDHGRRRGHQGSAGRRSRPSPSSRSRARC